MFRDSPWMRPVTRTLNSDHAPRWLRKRVVMMFQSHLHFDGEWNVWWSKSKWERYQEWKYGPASND